MKSLRVLMILTIAVVTTQLAKPAFASAIFTDGTFNLSSYTINSYTTNGDTVNVMQTLTGGNPGAALEVMISAPPTGGSTSYAFTYALNNGFVFDLSMQGVITSLSFSIDRDIASITGASLGSEAGTSIIFQSGSYYQFVIGLSANVGKWETASATNLVAGDYDLITNLTTGDVDTSSHPNFAGGPITFGERTGWTIGAGTPVTTGVNLSDNMSYNIVSVSSVPETATFGMVSLGLVGIVVAAWKRKSQINAFR
jgi:hypothetical protein